MSSVLHVIHGPVLVLGYHVEGGLVNQWLDFLGPETVARFDSSLLRVMG
jgi:hypothetical protein